MGGNQNGCILRELWKPTGRRSQVLYQVRSNPAGRAGRCGEHTRFRSACFEGQQHWYENPYRRAGLLHGPDPGGDARPYTGRRQPCAMLSTGEASAALGQAVASVEQRGTTICEYSFGSNGQHFDVDYTWQGGGMTMGLTRGAMKHVAGMNTFTSLDGIGDEAYLAPGNSALMMRKGDVMVNIDLRESGVSAEAAENMARTIAGRL